MLTNKSSLPLPIALWLAHDDYDFQPASNALSATSLIKPLRQVVLGQRVPRKPQEDVLDKADSRLGTAIHSAIETVITNRNCVDQALVKLALLDTSTFGTTQDPIYVERRTEKTINNFIVSGKFDFVYQNIVHDIKTAKTFTYITGSRDKAYAIQGSIYRWLNQDIITEDFMRIVYIFMDWKEHLSLEDKTYPQNKILVKTLTLLSLEETEAYISNKLDEISQYLSSPQEQLPLCSSEDLWEQPSIYAYYKDPNKLARSTKNFDSMDEALRYKGSNPGIIKVRPGKVKACNWCAARDICSQAEQLKLEGRLS